MATQLSDGNPAGTSLGQDATDLISFYGETPVAQQTVTAIASTGTVPELVATVTALQTALAALGIIADA